MEFKMTTDLAVLPPEITFNFEELKTELEARLEHYNSLVLTEDTIKEGRAERAALNKLRTAVEDRRKEVKRQYEVPLKAFEGRVKELVALIDQPIAAIDAQLAAFEDQRKQSRLEQIRALYSEIVTDTNQDVIPLERILDKRWLNATTTMNQVEADLINANKRASADLLAISAVREEYRAGVLARYKETLDVEAALAYQDALRASAQALLGKEDPEPAKVPTTRPEAREKVYRLALEMRLTAAQGDRLKEFLVREGITFRKI